MACSLTGHAENWPCWRGPRLDGTSLETGVPLQWSATQNVAWKTALPGVGHASPIVWDDRVFTVTALPDERSGCCCAWTAGPARCAGSAPVLTAPLERSTP